MTKITADSIGKMRIRQMIEDCRTNVDAGLTLVNGAMVNLKPVPKFDRTSITAELVEEIKEELKFAIPLQAAADERWQVIGRKLKQLKACKPEGITWANYVRQEFDLSQERADELIRIGEGRTTVIKVRERAKQSMKKSRKSVKRVTGKTTAKSNRSRQPSACEIDWENYKDDEEESDSVTNLRAADWQLHEAERLAEEFALLRPGTRAKDIKNKHVERAVTISRKWKKLAEGLQAKQGGK